MNVPPFKVRSLENAADDVHHLKERLARAEAALAEKEQQLRLALEAAHRGEQRHQQLLDSVTDYVYTVQIEGGRAVETVHGPGCVGVTGYTLEEFAADPHLWIRMVPAEDQPAVLAQAARLLAGQEAAPLEHRILHKNGSIRWIRNTFVLHRDAHGQVTAYNGLISGITERKLAEESLRNSEALYHSLVESIPLNMFRKDLLGRFTFANQRFCESLGRPLEQILGKTDLDFYPQTLADKYRRDDLRVQATGDVLEDTEQHQLASGARLYVAVMKTPVYDAQHKLVGTQGLFWDVTERKWAEEQRAQMRVARAIQQNLLPTAAPERAGFDFGGATFPAEATGGDYFDYLTLNDAVGVVLGDVSGHGFGPALLAAVIHACMRTLARMDLNMETILATANRLLMENTDGERFATVVCARVDPATRFLVYSSAGHPAGFLLDGCGHVKARLADTGPALGVFPDGVFPTAPPMVLESGDLVLFMSDGVQDAMGPERAFFGVERALNHVRSNRHLSAAEIATTLCQAAQTFSQGAQIDDITAVVIKVQ